MSKIVKVEVIDPGALTGAFEGFLKRGFRRLEDLSDGECLDAIFFFF